MFNEYQAEVDSYLERKVIEPVARDEIKEWQEMGNTACFISHHAYSGAT